MKNCKSKLLIAVIAGMLTGCWLAPAEAPLPVPAQTPKDIGIIAIEGV